MSDIPMIAGPFVDTVLEGHTVQIHPDELQLPFRLVAVVRPQTMRTRGHAQCSESSK